MSTLLFSTLSEKLNQDPPAAKRSPAAQQLYDACHGNRRRFAEEFFPHICTHAFNQVHLDYYARCDARQGSRGHHDVTAAPRGFSKTSGCATIGIFYDCAYQVESYILYLTNSFSNAVFKVKDIRDELTDNDKFISVYGVQESGTWNQDFFITRGGVGVAAAGRRSQLRGKTKRFKRFTKIVIDDIEYPEEVLSELQRDKTHNFVHNDVLKLGEPSTNVEVFGTILHPQSELSGLLKTSGWERYFYQAVIRFADAASVPLWQEWRTLFIDIGNLHHAEDARTFFEAHEDEMLRGHEVLWPDRKSYYDLMIERVVEGESSFWQELMNQPLADTRYLFDLDNAAYCTLRPEGILRADGTFVHFNAIHEVAAYLDPTPEKRDVKGSDYACCAVGMKDRDGYEHLVGMYLAQEGSTTKQIAGVVDLLWQFQVPKLGIEANGFASLMVQDIREAIAQRAQDEGIAWDVQLIPIVNMRNKILRIKSLEPRLANGWLQMAHTLPSQCYQQFSEYLPIEGSGHDDAPDAVEGLVRVLNGLYEKRDMS